MPDETRSAEYLRGARAALTRMAAEFRGVGYNAWAQRIEESCDREYPAPRVRAVVPDGWRQGKWELYREEWHYSAAQPLKTPVFPSREEVAAMYALQQHADAEGCVTEGEGLGAAAPNSERGAGEPPSASAAAPTIQSHSPAPTPARREWWLNVYAADDVYVHMSRESAWESGSEKTEIVHVREVRPLTAAQVEALAKAIGRACDPSVYVSYKTLARAALAHLNIPYEEA